MSFKSSKPGYEEARQKFVEEMSALEETLSKAEARQKKIEVDFLEEWRPFPEGQKVKITRKLWDDDVERTETLILYARWIRVSHDGDFYATFIKTKKDGSEGAREEFVSYDEERSLEPITS